LAFISCYVQPGLAQHPGIPASTHSSLKWRFMKNTLLCDKKESFSDSQAIICVKERCAKGKLQ
jgi:hypothetical protein